MGEKVKVAVLKCPGYDNEQVYRAVKESLKLIGFRFRKGQRVLLKPNMLAALPPEKAVTTHPSVVGAVCRLAKEAGCEITIGESSGSSSTKKAFAVCGMNETAKKYGAKTIVFEASRTVERESGNRLMPRIRMAQAVLEADVVVNVPKMKTHVLTRYTGAVKNMFGAVPGGLKRTFHAKGGSTEGFCSLLVDIYRQRPPELTVMDGVEGIEGNGPGLTGKKKFAGLILASKNGVALDVEAARIMGFGPGEVPTTNIAIGRGLLPGGEGSVEVAGETGLSVPFAKPISRLPPWFIITFLQERTMARPVPDKKLCKKCGECAKACPVKAISMKGFPMIDRKKCIHCYCCSELCPFAAMKLQRPEPFRTFFHLLKRLKKAA